MEDKIKPEQEPILKEIGEILKSKNMDKIDFIPSMLAIIKSNSCERVLEWLKKHPKTNKVDVFEYLIATIDMKSISDI